MQPGRHRTSSVDKRTVESNFHNVDPVNAKRSLLSVDFSNRFPNLLAYRDNWPPFPPSAILFCMQILRFYGFVKFYCEGYKGWTIWRDLTCLRYCVKLTITMFGVPDRKLTGCIKFRSRILPICSNKIGNVGCLMIKVCTR